MRTLFGFARRGLKASPARHPRMAVVIGRLLGVAFGICFATGLYSHFIQNPIPGMFFPSTPVNLYRITQGTHVITGLLCIPLLLGKLYTIYPLLFKWPPVTGLLTILERASITIFVSGSLVQLFTGLWNTYQWYVWPFPFRQVHYALAYIIIASLIIHIGVKLPIIRRWFWRRNSVDATGNYLPVEPGEGELRPQLGYARGFTGVMQRWIDKPAQPTPEVSRRTVIGTLTAMVATLFLTTGGQTIPWLKPFNVFSPRSGAGPQQLPINKTAREARVTDKAMNSGWVLTVRGPGGTKTFTLDDLRRLPQYTVSLPIACVEGWSRDATWRGVRFKDLAALVGAGGASFTVQSLQRGAYATTLLENNFVKNPLTLIALELNGQELTLDHGYPARLIAPARPGVLQTKWLESLVAK